MTRKSKILVISALVFLFFGAATFLFVVNALDSQGNIRIIPRIVKVEPSPTPAPSPVPIPDQYVIPQQLHIFQSFNNCGPATLSMALSYFGIEKSQDELGKMLRPYQIPGGDNDDKSVTLREVAEEAEKYGLRAYLRPNGTPEKMQQFIANGIPVVTRTWTKKDEDIGHYRIVRGYDRSNETFLQDDSLQDKNVTYSEADFLEIWKPYNYEYLVLVPDDKVGIAERILGEEVDEKVAWQNGLGRLEAEIAQDPENWHLTFALSRVYYYLGNYKRSIDAFEKVEDRLSFRTMWYQIEPIQSYFELGNYTRVIQLTDRILNNQNRAFSELYVIRGNVYQKQGENALARAEYEKAVEYNVNLASARQALSSL